LGENVKIHGAYGTDDLPRIFAASDLVVLPSLYEGLPLVLVEAMLHGIPVVATSAGGTVELGEENPDVIISNGTDWFHFEAGLGDMAQRLRDGRIDGVRLHDWTESRYGFEKVAKAWRQALLDPQSCFVKRMEIPAPRDQPINVNNCAEVVR
jgi:glycosyltransferase involved in cell wall biosynthesis